MNRNAVNVAVVDGKTITQTTELPNGGAGKPIRIKAVADGKYILAEGDKGVAPENITIKRVGKDLHVALEGTDPDQPQLIIEGFFDAQGQLVGVGEDGAYYEYISSDAEQDHSAPFLIDGVSAPQVLGSEQLVGFGNGLVAGTGIGWFWPALLGLAGIGLLGAVYAAVKDDDDKKDDKPDAAATRPNTPSLDGAVDNVGDKTGQIENGGVTDDTTPTFSGVGTPGNTIIVSDGGVVIGEVVVGDDGTWEFTPEPPLAGGAHEIIVVEEDPQGNQSDPSDGFEFVVDLTAPGKSVITDAQDNVGDQQGLVVQNGVTDDNTPLLRGNAEPGSTVEVYANGVKIGETLANADGNWSFTANPALADGQYSFTTVAVDAAGNRGLASDPYVLIIDTSLSLISITEVTDSVGTITDPLVSGGVTDDTTPTLNGRATPNSTVNIYDNGVLIGSAMSDASGNWSFTPLTELAEGDHSFTATVTPPTGGESAPTPVFELEIDITAPGKPGEGGNGGIDEVTDNVGNIVGPIADGGSTDDPTPTLGGGGQEPGDVVTIIDNGNPIGEAIVDEDGNWSFTPNPALNDGPHDFTVIVTDPAGNASEPSDPYTVIIDTVAPAQAVITSVVDDQGAVTGAIVDGAITDDAQPQIMGTAEANSTVIIYDNGVEIGRAPVDAAGNWSFTPPLPLLNGNHEVTVAAIDAAGNEGAASAPFNFELIAGGVPQAPTISGITDDVGIHTGNVSQGGVTDDARPTVNGTGQPGATISVIANDVLLGTTVADANGQWSFPVPTDLVNGPHDITATATDAAGNVSPPTGDYSITVDTTAPAASTAETLSDDVGAVTGPITDGGVTDDSNPTLSGTAEPGTTVIIYDNNVEIGRAPVAADGSWSFTPGTALVDGEHSFHTVVEDEAGNHSPASDPIDFTVDTSAVVISITEVTDNMGTIVGALTNGGVSDDTTPTLNGRATPNATVTIYDKGTAIGTVMSDASGNWTFTPETELAEGDHSFTATVTTEAGGESDPTAVFDLEIDITAPGTPGEGANGGIDNINDDVGNERGPIADGGSTDDPTPTLSGGGQQPGDVVTIIDNGNTIGEAIVGDDGNWSFTPNPALNDGEHDFTMIVTDPAGNASEESDPYTVIIDTVAPTAQATVVSMGKDSGSDSGDFLTNDGTAGRLIQGSLTAALATGETVQVSVDGGATWLDAVLNGDGTWSFVDETAHAGDWEIQTRVVDAASNIGTVASQEISLDTTPPNAPASVSRTGDVVTVDVTGTNASAGDTLFVNVGETQVSHTLTQSELDVGIVTVEVLAGSQGTVTSFMVDGAGNSSGSTGIARTLIDDFASLGANFSIGVGVSAERNFYTLTNVTGILTSLDQALWIGETGNGDTVLSTTVMSLDAPATSVGFTVFGVSDPDNNIFYIDQNGNEIHSETANVDGDYRFTAPAGVLIAEVKFVIFDTNGVAIDNFQITTSGEVFDPVNESIDNAIQYFGTSDNGVFSIENVSNLVGADSGVHGGAGLDTLKLTGQNQMLDLTSIGEKLTSIEVIDLTGIGNNTLKLSLDDVLNNGETDLFHESGKTQMMVNGNAGDVVDLEGLISAEDPGTWGAQGNITVGGVVYDVYSHSSLDAELLVQQGVMTNVV